jgi:hypothetical protein
MFHMADALQKIVGRFYDSPFPQQQLFLHIYQFVLHAPFQPCYQLYSPPAQPLKQLLRYTAPVSKELPSQFTA